MCGSEAEAEAEAGVNSMDTELGCKPCGEDDQLIQSSRSDAASFISSNDFEERDHNGEDANQTSLDTGQNYLKTSSPSPLHGVDGSEETATVEYHNPILRDIEVLGPAHLGGPRSAKQDAKPTHLLLDPNIWVPPEPQDMEDDVVNYHQITDDQPSPLSRLCEDRSVRFKHEFHKAITFTMNGRFKNIVSRLLMSEGIVVSNNPGESWVDILTSLAWEAALLIAPDTTTSELIDPQGSLKVKCIATGLCSQSQLIKGLVFKKNAAHKHMQSKHQSPKLLLLKGMLGNNSSGLSSFDSMKQEKDNLESFVEMIEMCHPNVVLVEKTVSRDVQESFIAKGITLVFDMKLHRLQRIARYTDSKIFSSDDNLSSHKLKQCHSLYFEKFVEEHVIPREGGKKPIKTLMLLEGYHRPLGCTVLLKGAHSDELKKIKYILHSAVILAYHLILETSFLVDHKEMLSTIHSLTMDDCANEHLAIVGPSIFQTTASLEESLHGTDSLAMDLPRSDGSGEAPACELTSQLSMDSALHGATLPSAESTYFDIEIKGSFHVVESSVDESPGCEVPVELCIADVNNEENQIEAKDSVNTTLDSQSILYLVSSRSVSRKPSCNQSRLCRVKYYKNFDVSLGEFLHDILDQKHQCSVCTEAQEAHVYNYVNRSGKLTVQVKNLSADLRLPGEAEGKLWMWAQCSKCQPTKKSQGSTRRVVMSTAARGLSFGKFLELNFSAHSAFKGLSGCGHAHQTDYLRFYGLGSMVTMFSYSPVKIYLACMPPSILDFSVPIGQDWIQNETKNVLEKGMLLFTEVTDILQKIEFDICSSNSIPPGKVAGLAKRFSEVKERLKEEKFNFEVKIRKRMDKNERLGQSVHEFLSLNSSVQELMLESYVWDQRLRSFTSNEFGKFTVDHIYKMKVKEEQLQYQKNGIENQIVEGRTDTSQNVSEETNSVLIDRCENNLFPSLKNCDDLVNHSRDAEMEIKLDGLSVKDIEHSGKGFLISEYQCEGFDPESNGRSCSSVDSQSDGRPAVVLHSNGTTVSAGQLSLALGDANDSHFHQDSSTNLSDSFSSLHVNDGNHLEPLSIPKPLQIIDYHLQDDESFANSDVHASEYIEASSAFSCLGLESGLSTSQSSDDLQDMVWKSFPEIREAYKMDLLRGGLRKFEFVDSYTPECLSQANQLLTGKGGKLHIPLGLDDYVVSAYEDEPTSIIACALALLHEGHRSDENLAEKAKGKGNRVIKSSLDNAPPLDSDISVESPYWSSNGSLDSQGIHSVESVTSEMSYTSIFDASTLVDPENPHPEVPLWGRKLRGKENYSVVCLYEKEFRALRRHCCPCELDYISSLSHCKSWDAKGGKSGALFVKTLDDRFIVKQIQKTEFESFLKFGPDYFDYSNKSISSGSQTCLAKILGIYQLTVRQPKSGKEVKYDLMVMENLLFGRTITRLYDLKGAQYARYTKDTDGTGKVFLDTNFVEDMDISPLYISLKNKHLLQRAVWNDTSFLTSINVMDYSLLVGVDTERNELVCGIIDYLRQYTWDKHLETWVKTSLVVPKNVTPTVVSPKEYKKRFRKFMDLHFLTIPDHFHPERCGTDFAASEITPFSSKPDADKN